jgi:alpha-tubulin suppressor-like RCC1 family protein
MHHRGVLSVLTALTVASTLLALGCGSAGAPDAPERTGAAEAALTPGAGSVGSCTGNPARCAAVMLTAGSEYTVALQGDGRVWAWGRNNAGQLGDGSTDDKSTPAQVVALGGVVGVAAGGRHTVMLEGNGRVWAWGHNDDGQLGDGTTAGKSTPVLVKGAGGSGTLNDAVAVAAGDDHTVALKSDGSVWMWGYNGAGQLGDGTWASTSTPVPVKGAGGAGTLSDGIAVAAGTYHTVALKSDGSVWTWGRNNDGQLGDGTTAGKTTPVPVKGAGGSGTLSDVVAVAAGAGHTVALKSDGSVWAWGYNVYGQLGDGTTFVRNTPVQVKDGGGSGTLSDVVAVAASGYHTVALKSDGSVWAWGANFYGELGDGTTDPKATPVQVKGQAGAGTLSGVVGVATGDYHTVALKSDGGVWAWGANVYGELGDGETVDKSTPVPVKGQDGVGTLSGVVAVAVASYHTVALKSDGGVSAWGGNNLGQLGDGKTDDKSTPVQVSGLSLTQACFGLPTCDADPGSATFGACVAPTVPNGASCDDDNPSTLNEVCFNGACIDLCVGVTCAAQDQCHDAGACDPATGACSKPAKPNGTGCDDGSACTAVDACQAGVCTGASPKTCSGHGLCDPATSACFCATGFAGADCDGCAPGYYNYPTCTAQQGLGVSCTADADCASGAFCAGNMCIPRFPQGVACGSDAQCASGFCVDKVCCESACDGQCQACGEAESAGSCVTVAGAPRAGRAACAGTGACQGACDGANGAACAFPDASVSCAAASCEGGQAIEAASCDGAGTCASGATTSCGGYACDAEACKTDCAGNDDCASGYVCEAASCVEGAGGTGGSGGAGGAGGAGGSGGAGGVGDSGGSGGGTGGAPDPKASPGELAAEGGCGCREAPGSAGLPGAGWLGLVAAAATVVRRRRAA